MEDRDLISKFLDELKKDNFSDYTILNYEHDINEFLEYLLSEKLSKNLVGVYRVRICQYYIAYLSKQKYSAKSINRKLSSLRTFYNYLLKEKEIDFNPFTEVHNVKTEKTLPKFVDNEDIISLINNIDTKTSLGIRNKLLIEMLFATGMRVSEICNLEVKQIDFYNDEIKVFGKGKKERIVYLYDSLSYDLNNYINYTRNDLLAHSMNLDIKNVFINYKGGALTPRGVRKIINNEIEKHSLNLHISPHMLRHSFATSMLNNGLDLRSVQTLLGHENLSTTQIYTHVTNASLRETLDKSFPRNKKID